MPKKTKSPEGPRTKQIKFYVTHDFKDSVDRFHDEHRELGSLGDFGMAALSFFMLKYAESGYHRDRSGFPAVIAAESQGEYRIRGRTDHKK